MRFSYICKAGRPLILVQFLFREKQGSARSERGAFELIGKCYVHGLIHDEVLQWEGFGWNDSDMIEDDLAPPIGRIERVSSK